MKNPFKKEKDIKQRFKEGKVLLKPFLKKYKEPAIVHSVYDTQTFKQILKDNKLKLPKEHRSRKKCLYMEQILGIDNAIYYSLGFAYSTAYDWKYNLIFDLNYLKELVYYSNSINYQCYKLALNYLYENDRESFEKFSHLNEKTEEVIDKYLHKKYNGKVRMIFDFWKVEKNFFDFIMKHPNKNKILKMIKEKEREVKIPYPKSLISAKKDHLTDKVPEIIGKKSNNLLTNKHFLGFYIVGKIPHDIQLKLKKNYPNKIIFDGKKIKKISEVLK